MRIARLNMMIPDCPRCGNPIMINGFTQMVICESCHSEIHIRDGQWHDVFCSVHQETRELFDESSRHLALQAPGTFEIHAEGAGMRALPCSRCGGDIDIEGISADVTALSCPACDQEYSLIQLPNRTRGEKACFAISHTSDDEEEPRLRQMAPILINCPNCGGALKISHENERITACEYCSGEFVVPDPLWRRLHPVKTVTPWYVLYDQPPLPTREEIGAQREQKRIDTKRRQLQKLLWDLDGKVTDLRGSFGLATGVGYGVLAFIGLFLIGFPLIFVPPLTHLIGDRVCNGEFEVQMSSTGDGTSYEFSSCTNTRLARKWRISR